MNTTPSTSEGLPAPPPPIQGLGPPPPQGGPLPPHQPSQPHHSPSIYHHTPAPPPPPPVTSCGLPQSAVDILMSAGMNLNQPSTSVGNVVTVNGKCVATVKGDYRLLKKRFKFLVYENECYQEELRNLQRKLLKLSRDKNFLLDRLTQFEKLSDSSDDSDCSIPKNEEKKPKKRARPSTTRKRPSRASGSGPGVGNNGTTIVTTAVNGMQAQQQPSTSQTEQTFTVHNASSTVKNFQITVERLDHNNIANFTENAGNLEDKK